MIQKFCYYKLIPVIKFSSFVNEENTWSFRDESANINTGLSTWFHKPIRKRRFPCDLICICFTFLRHVNKTDHSKFFTSPRGVLPFVTYDMLHMDHLHFRCSSCPKIMSFWQICLPLMSTSHSRSGVWRKVSKKDWNEIKGQNAN